MMRVRLWSGLQNIKLKNASKFLFQKNLNFNTLRKKLKAIKKNLRLSKLPSSLPLPPKLATPEANISITSSNTPNKSVPEQQCVTTVHSKLLQKIRTLSKQMEGIKSQGNSRA
jgi:hypothetical protein